MSKRLRVSLIATVKNECDAVNAWLGGIACQTRLPDEVIIVDGGSTDGTLQILQAWQPGFPVNVISLPDASISAGRNHALRRATGDVIAITDCGTVAAQDWLERLTEPFADPDIDVVGGFFVPGGPTRWELALAAATLPDAGELRPDRFLPSSRSVAVRSSWTAAGFEYPEWLDYCEDLIWDLQLKNAGARFCFAPDAVVTFRVRPDARAFWIQYFRYARGDGKAGLFGKRHAVRYATYLGLLAAIARHQPPELALTGVLAAVYAARPIRRLLRRNRAKGVTPSELAMTSAIIPFQLAIGDVAKMSGYPVGLFWRFRRFGTLNPAKNWRRVSPDGRMWSPAEPLETPLRQAD